MRQLNGSHLGSGSMVRLLLVIVFLVVTLGCAGLGIDTPGPDPDPDPSVPVNDGLLGSWRSLAPVPGSPRQEVTFVQVGGRLYLSGGGTRHQVYDPGLDAWRDVAALEGGWRDHVQGVALDGDIYYVGGLSGWPSSDTNDLDRVDVYDPESDSWAPATPLPRARGGGGAAAYAGKLYYAGGLSSGNSVDWFEVYDPVTGTWTELDPMPTARDHFHAVVLEDALYTIGGRDVEFDDIVTTVDRYDFARGSWETLDTELPTPRGGFATAVVDDEILVIGGEGFGMTFDDVEAYHPASNTWRSLREMGVARHGIQAAVCEGAVYVAGGGTVQGGGGQTDATEVFAFGDVPGCGPYDGFTTVDWASIVDEAQPARAEAQGLAVGSDLYVFGGFRPALEGNSHWDAYCVTQTSFRYDVEGNAWTQIADMPGYYTHASLVADGTDILLAGARQQLERTGEDDEPCSHLEVGTTEVWTYDTVTGVWSNVLPDLPEARSSGGMVLVGRNLHFFSGTGPATESEKGDHWVLDLDDPGSGWSDLAALPNPRTHIATGVVGGAIYVIGGQHGTGIGNVAQDDVHRYDPATDTWLEMAPLPTARSHLSASVDMAGRVIVIGGESGHSNALNEVLAFDPAKNSWVQLSPVPTAGRSGVAGRFGPQIVYARGEFSSLLYRGTPQPE